VGLLLKADYDVKLHCKEYENGLIHSKSGHLRGLQSLTLQATGLWKNHDQDPV